MRTRRKIAALACSALLIVGVAAASLAYLTSFDTATNTFTVGKVEIVLDEAKVNPDGSEVQGADRVQANKYHLLPGHTYVKDPTVTVSNGSEDAYVRMMVKVENLKQLKAALPNSGETAEYYATDGTFLLQMLCMSDYGPNAVCTWNSNAWEFEKYHDTGEYADCYEFRYKTAANDESGPARNGVLEPLFTRITVPGILDNEGLDKLGAVQIKIAAQAIQVDGFEDNADSAFAELPAVNWDEVSVSISGATE